MLSKRFCLIDISILGKFLEQAEMFCHPNTKMVSTDLENAKKECMYEQSCHMFYRVCSYPQFRQCDDTAGIAYEEPSTCGKLGPSRLYNKGNRNAIGHFLH